MSIPVLTMAGTGCLERRKKLDTALRGRWPQQVPPSLLSSVCCHHLIPTYVMAVLQFQQGFPGRRKLLALCYLLQWYKRRRKALLYLRNVASLVAEGRWWGLFSAALKSFWIKFILEQPLACSGFQSGLCHPQDSQERKNSGIPHLFISTPLPSPSNLTQMLNQGGTYRDGPSALFNCLWQVINNTRVWVMRGKNKCWNFSQFILLQDVG